MTGRSFCSAFAGLADVLTDDDNGFSDVADAEQRLLNESRARPVAGDN